MSPNVCNPSLRSIHFGEGPQIGGEGSLKICSTAQIDPLIRHFVPWNSPHWEAQGLCNFLSGQLKFLWEAQKNALPLGEGLLKAHLIRIS